MKISNQEGNVISLSKDQQGIKGKVPTGTGFLRKMTKFSARIIINRVNLWHNIRSISSLCLILIEMRRELMEPSTKTCSFSFLEMITGDKRVSGENLEIALESTPGITKEEILKVFACHVEYLASTSGLLCLSTF